MTLKQFRDGKIEEAILAAEPPEETEEKPQDTPNGENKGKPPRRKSAFSFGKSNGKGIIIL